MRPEDGASQVGARRALGWRLRSGSVVRTNQRALYRGHARLEGYESGQLPDASASRRARRSLFPRPADCLGSGKGRPQRRPENLSACCNRRLRLHSGMLVNSPEGIARIVEGVITGIGFIGGGAILKTGATVHAFLWEPARRSVAPCRCTASSRRKSLSLEC